MEKDGKKRETSVVTRRQFITGAGTLVAGGVVGAVAGRQVFPKEILVKKESPEKIALSDHLVVYPEKCVGCEQCMLACALFHGDTCSPSLSRVKIVKNYFTSVTGDFHQEVCRQCIAPECLVVCPVGAIGVDPKTGARVVDENECIGCKACVEACPFGMIFFDEEKEKSFKCDLCGGDPQCVRICTMAAIEYVLVKEGGE